jgi:plasmid stabilization system protein ParE
MTPVKVHPAAQVEFDEVRELLRGADPRLAAAFAECVEEHVALIAQNPLLFHERRFTVRRANLRPRFGEYYIAFLLWRGQAVILAIAHGKRRPFYFRRRIGEARRMF